MGLAGPQQVDSAEDSGTVEGFGIVEGSGAVEDAGTAEGSGTVDGRVEHTVEVVGPCKDIVGIELVVVVVVEP